MGNNYTIIRAKREALHALRPERQFLRVVLWLTLAAVVLVSFLALNGHSVGAVLLTVAALAVPLGIAEWRFERHPLVIAKWSRRFAFFALVAFLVASVIRLEFLWVCMSLVLLSRSSLSSVEAQAERRLEKYLFLGGQMDELFQPQTPRDRPTANPTGAVILILLFAFGVAVIWPSPHTSGRIGIGGR